MTSVAHQVRNYSLGHSSSDQNNFIPRVNERARHVHLTGLAQLWCGCYSQWQKTSTSSCKHRSTERIMDMNMQVRRCGKGITAWIFSTSLTLPGEISWRPSYWKYFSETFIPTPPLGSRVWAISGHLRFGRTWQPQEPWVLVIWEARTEELTVHGLWCCLFK